VSKPQGFLFSDWDTILAATYRIFLARDPTTAPLQHRTNVRGTTPEWERPHKADLSAWFAWVLNPRPISFLRLSFVSLTQDDTPTSILPVVTTTLQSVLMGGRNEIGRGLSPRRTQAGRFPTGLLTSHRTIKQNNSFP
jgi:hypothetical protein